MVKFLMRLSVHVCYKTPVSGLSLMQELIENMTNMTHFYGSFGLLTDIISQVKRGLLVELRFEKCEES